MHPSPSDNTSARSRRTIPPGLPLLGGATLVVLGLPALGILIDAVRGAMSGTAGDWWWLSWTNIAKTVGCAALIGLLAAALGWPIAWTCRKPGTRWLLLLIAPAMFPGFLAYSGWGVLRQPGTATGDWIDRVRASGWQGFPHVVDIILAVGGLSLWAAPIAAGFMLAGARSVGDDTLEAAMLDGGAGGRRRIVWSVAWRWILAAAGVVGSLMVGASIPLHLARVETAGVQLWARLDLVPPDRHWQVWIAAWPVVLLAAAGGWGMARAIGRIGEGAEDVLRHDRTAGVLARVATLAVVLVGVGGPMGLFASGLAEDPSVLGQYWRTHRGSVWTSGVLGAVVGAAGVLLLLAAWRWAGTGRARGVMIVAAAWTAAALLPGVMVGSAVARGFGMVDRGLGLDLGETMIPVVAGMLARNGFVAVWAGVLLGLAEPRDARDRRNLDGAVGWAGWVESTAFGQRAAVIAAGIAMFGLAFQEIESVVLTLWPGGGLLARKVLDDLHFFRTRELAAGVVLMGGVIAFAGALVARLVWNAGRDARAGGDNASPNAPQ